MFMKRVISYVPSSHTKTKEATAFIGLRYISNALWIGGTALGVTAQRNYGVDPFVACSTLAASVATVEYAGTNIATKVFSGSMDANSSEEDVGILTRISKDTSAGVYSAWAGAMSAVEINNSLGLPNTRKRRVAQSGLYGAGVSLWSSQIPPFKQGQDALIQTAEAALENPLEGAIGGLAVSLAFFGGSRAYRKFREKREAKKPIKVEVERKPIDKKVGASVLAVLAYGAYVNKNNKR
jgi:hypothetical protein